MKVLFSMVFTILFISSSFAQNSEKIELGAEVQWYPAGWLLGPVFQYHHRPNHVFFAKLGINLADRHDWSGLNDDERGIGFGGSLGYRCFLRKDKSTPFIGTRGELYNTNIHWKNDIGKTTETSGTTKIIVYQPSFEVGYWFKPQNSKWSYTLSAGAGIEINILTRGRQVGEGGMWLSTFSILRMLD